MPGFETAKALSVSVDDYAEYTSGLLRSWLYDLFCNGFTGNCILVACGTIGTQVSYNAVSSPSGNPQEQGWYELSGEEYVLTTDTEVQEGKTYYEASESADTTSFVANMEQVYSILKPYAYHKTVCAGLDDAVTPAAAVALAKLCAGDKGLLSGAPYLPYTTSTPEDPMTDPLYQAISSASTDAFMSAQQDTTRNGALYSLGLALATYNGSGTCVGTSMDMIASSNITCSGANGLNLAKAVRSVLKEYNIQSFKPVGDNTGSVAAEGAETIQGDVVQATWILAYITYMVKVRIARLITTANFLKNAANYRSILNVMSEYLSKFGTSGSRRLEGIAITAPSFGALPEAQGDEIIIPNAWSATYVDQVRNVQITGSLYIGA